MFGGRKTKKELEELKEEHHDLEERFDDLQKEHDRLQHEAGEQTNMRISYIEEEIESMNRRVEKLATDSYEIRGEVRDIHESVLGMQTSLSEIVKLYKAIITQYGFGEIKQAAQRRTAPTPKRGPGEEPGDDIIRALEKERDGPTRATPKRTAPSERSTRPGAGGNVASPPPKPRPAPMSSNALDELHRLSETPRDEGDLAAKMVARSGRSDKVDRVARRDLERPDAGELDREGDFTRSLPKKDLRPREKAGSGTSGPGSGWESVEPPEGSREGRRPKPKLEDLLSPE